MEEVVSSNLTRSTNPNPNKPSSYENGFDAIASLISSVESTWSPNFSLLVDFQWDSGPHFVTTFGAVISQAWDNRDSRDDRCERRLRLLRPGRRSSLPYMQFQSRFGLVVQLKPASQPKQACGHVRLPPTALGTDATPHRLISSVPMHDHFCRLDVPA